MHFSKKEQKRIAKLYELGEVISCKLIAGGLVNYNFQLTTNNGRFIIRFLSGHSANISKEEEFTLLNYLVKKRLPYQIPAPIKNNNGYYITKSNGVRLWVYKMLEGKLAKNTSSMRKELAVCNAKLNVKLKGLPGNVDKSWPFTIAKTRHELSFLLKKPKGKTKVDCLFHAHAPFMYEIAKKLSDYEDVSTQWIHSDIYFSNVLVNKGKITGLLDFDNVVYLRKTFDIASTLCSVCTKDGVFNAKSATEFMKAYEKVSPLNSKEREAIVREMLRVQIVGYLWLYVKMKKFPQRKYALIKDTIFLTQNLVAIEWPSN